MQEKAELFLQIALSKTSGGFSRRLRPTSITVKTQKAVCKAPQQQSVPCAPVSAHSIRALAEQQSHVYCNSLMKCVDLHVKLQEILSSMASPALARKDGSDCAVGDSKHAPSVSEIMPGHS